MRSPGWVDEVAAFIETTEPAHQPRERAVPCQRCSKPTGEVHAVCTACGPETCPSCAPNVIVALREAASSNA